MPKPKLYLYKAADAPIAVILRRGTKKSVWEMIRWDLLTDTFTEGQWLTHKTVHGKDASISADGQLFAYQYDVYGSEYESCAVVSRIPNFSAVLFTAQAAGHWDHLGFSADGSVATSIEEGWVAKEDSVPNIVSYTEKADSGYMPGPWKDLKDRTIVLDGAKVVADGEVLYDTTDHVFQAKPAL